MLKLENVHSYYDKSHILEGVSLEVGEGELVTLLGRNGAGKTTTLRSIMGIVVPRQGSIKFEGTELVGRESYAIARSGIKLVPEHRGIFNLLSVAENLQIADRKDSPWRIPDIYAMFPRLEERRRNPGHALSGGEQQMLAIARALVNNPRVLLLDEPTEGLAPVIVDEITHTLQKLRAAGMAILLVEQNIAVCEKVADRHYLLEEGHIVYSGTQDEFSADPSIRNRYLALSA